MKFIHIADVHLGAKPDRNKPWAKERERHSWQALEEVIARAREEHVDLILIAGDLFHRQPLLRELKEVNYLFSKLEHTHVVLIAGNHDYLSPNSYYRTFKWGENVHFLKEEHVEFVEIPMLRTRVYGLSYWHRELKKHLYDGIQIEEGRFYNILLAHGGDEQHIPFRTNEFLKAKFDYTACGHIHKPIQMVENKVIMAGALQPIDVNDVGEHGYFLGELTEKGCRVRFYPLQYCEYVPLNLKISREVTNGALIDLIKRRIEKSPSHQLFKITLTGVCDVDNPIEIRNLEQIERVVQVSDQCRPDYDFEKLKLQYGQQLVGRYIRALEEMPQDAVTKKALYYGVEALITE